MAEHPESPNGAPRDPKAVAIRHAAAELTAVAGAGLADMGVRDPSLALLVPIALSIHGLLPRETRLDAKHG